MPPEPGVRSINPYSTLDAGGAVDAQRAFAGQPVISFPQHQTHKPSVWACGGIGTVVRSSAPAPLLHLAGLSEHRCSALITTIEPSRYPTLRDQTALASLCLTAPTRTIRLGITFQLLQSPDRGLGMAETLHDWGFEPTDPPPAADSLPLGQTPLCRDHPASQGEMDDPDAGGVKPPGKSDAASDAPRPPQTKLSPNTASPKPASPRPQQTGVLGAAPAATTAETDEEVEYDDFGLPIKKPPPLPAGRTDSPSTSPDPGERNGRKWGVGLRTRSASRSSAKSTHSHRRVPSTTSLRGRRSRSSSISHNQIDVPDSDSGEDEFNSAVSRPISRTSSIQSLRSVGENTVMPVVTRLAPGITTVLTEDPAEMTPIAPAASQKLAGKDGNKGDKDDDANAKGSVAAAEKDKPKPHAGGRSRAASIASSIAGSIGRSRAGSVASTRSVRHGRQASTASAADPAQLSEFSHQALATKKEEAESDDDGGWQEMPSYAAYDIYDDDNRLVAKEFNEAEDETEKYGYGGLGGAGKGYTKVLVDDDAESATSMDENTNYLFKGAGTSLQDEEDARDAVSQLQATKDLL
ncbi:hypothetical protein MAPG_06456, partial [Magnaporthiopsis poae ATCC 64411]